MDAREQPAPKKRVCKAKRSNGEPCRKPPIKGGEVCSTHGGSAPQVKAKAAKRVVEERLSRKLADYWSEGAGVSPSVAYQRALDVASGNVAALVQLMQDDEKLTPEAVEFAQRMAGDAAKVAKMGIDAGIAERAVALAEQQAAAVVTVFREALAEGGVTGEQAATVARLFAEKLARVGA